MSAETMPVSVILLAGGRAMRFAGADKGLIELAGRPLVAWVARRLDAQASEILISANRHCQDYAALGYPVVADTLADFPGPLAGLLAAGRVAQAEWLLSAPCDVPFLPTDLVAGLMSAAATSGLARAADASGVHYAVMLLHRRLLDDLELFLLAGGRQVQAWQARHACATVNFAHPPEAFFNINTPADLAQAEQLVQCAGEGK